MSKPDFAHHLFIAADWVSQAACKGHDPNLWFPGKGCSAKKAIAICNTCDVINECREYGVANEKRGVWGGVHVGRKGPTMRRDAA